MAEWKEGKKYSKTCIPLFIFSSMVVAASCYGYARLGRFLKIKLNVIELITGKVLEGNLVQSDFQQTLGDKFTFHQDNNLKHKSKDTLELLTKMTLKVPGWPSYCFEINLLKSMARLKWLSSNDQQPTWQDLNNKKKKNNANIVQSRCAKLLKTYLERHTAVIAAKDDSNMLNTCNQGLGLECFSLWPRVFCIDRWQKIDIHLNPT